MDRPRPGELRNEHQRSAVNQYPPSGKLGDIDCLWLDDSVLTEGNYVRAALVHAMAIIMSPVGQISSECKAVRIYGRPGLSLSRLAVLASCFYFDMQPSVQTCLKKIQSHFSYSPL